MYIWLWSWQKTGIKTKFYIYCVLINVNDNGLVFLVPVIVRFLLAWDIICTTTVNRKETHRYLLFSFRSACLVAKTQSSPLPIKPPIQHQPNSLHFDVATSGSGVSSHVHWDGSPDSRYDSSTTPDWFSGLCGGLFWWNGGGRGSSTESSSISPWSTSLASVTSSLRSLIRSSQVLTGMLQIRSNMVLEGFTC